MALDIVTYADFDTKPFWVDGDYFNGIVQATGKFFNNPESGVRWEVVNPSTSVGGPGGMQEIYDNPLAEVLNGYIQPDSAPTQTEVVWTWQIKAIDFRATEVGGITPTPTVTKDFSISIKWRNRLTSNAAATAYVGQPYSRQLTALYPDTVFTPGASGLPAGLTLSSTGLISGTPTTVGTQFVSINTASATAPGSVNGSFRLAIYDPNAVVPTITTASLPAGTVGTAYTSTTLAATGTAPITWTASGLPTGLTLSSAGVLSGTPTAARTFSTTITATNAGGVTSKVFSVTIAAATAVKPTITTSSLPAGTATKPYTSTTLTATGTAPITWAATGLPAGLALSSSGVLSGTPTVSGTFSPSFTASNSAGSTPKTISITVAAAPVKPVITTTSLPAGVATKAYTSTTLAATGTAPITWTASGLPTGLTLSSAGVLSGTPTVSGSFSPLITATNAGGSTPKAFSITVAPAPVPPTITTVSPLPVAVMGRPYSATLTASGDTPITWNLIGLVPGLTLSSAGVLSGVPTSSGVKQFNVAATNAAGAIGKAFVLEVVRAPVIVTESIPSSGTVGEVYEAQIVAEQDHVLTWSAAGLPAGLSINAETGVISGTLAEAGNYSALVTASNAWASDSKLFTIDVVPPVIYPDDEEFLSIYGPLGARNGR